MAQHYQCIFMLRKKKTGATEIDSLRITCKNKCKNNIKSEKLYTTN